jgi:transcriptional regulator with XRE-family HTH domain
MRVTDVTDVPEPEGRAEWERRSEAMEDGQATVGGYPVPGLLRQARRMADLSQRQLAARAKVPQSTLARIESGQRVPSLKVFQRLLVATGLSLVVVDAEGHVIRPMRESDDTRDGGARRYPSHLDTILDPVPGEWWGDNYGLARPPETFYRNRSKRDAMRAMSEYEVRARLHRYESPPLEWGWRRSSEVARAWQMAGRYIRTWEIDHNELDPEE